VASDRWVWDPAIKRFRDTETGRLVRADTIRSLRDRFVESQEQQVGELAGALARAEITLQQWEFAFRQLILRALTAEYLLGRGGRQAMTQRDWGTIGALAKAQYEFARGFAADLAAGNLDTADAVAGRMAMYFGATREAHEIGRSEAYGMPRLPAYPCDGGTPCLTGCMCSWAIEETATEWRATWRLGMAQQHCSGCIGRAAAYAPIVMERSA
jgi:hypothetical protein